jgi:YD repeat-containing protein
MSRSSLSGRSPFASALLLFVTAVALLAFGLGSQPARSFAANAPRAKQQSHGAIASATGKLVAQYTTVDSDTYQLPDGRLLTRVFRHPTNQRASDSAARAATDAKLSPDTKRPGEPSLACTINSAIPEASACNEASFQVGVESVVPESYRRGLLLFTLPNLGPVSVEKARLALYETGSTHPKTYVPITAYPVLSEWSSTVTWKNPWLKEAGGEFTAEAYAANGEVETGQAETLGKTTGWHYWYPTRMVQQWINGAAAPNGEGRANDGLILKENGEGTENVITFAGLEQEEKGPYLEYTTVARGSGTAPNYTMLPISSSKSTTVKVNAASGNLSVESTDLSIATKGWPDFEASRTSNSLQPTAQPGFGSGWLAGNAPYVEAGSDGVKGRNGSEIYHDGTGNTFVFINNVNTEAKTPPGIEAIMCVAEEEGLADCPSKKAGEPLPHDAAFDLYYINSGVQIFFADKEGRNYPLAIKKHGEEEVVEAYSSVDHEPTVWKDSAGENINYTVSSTAGIGYTKISGPSGQSATYTETKPSEATGYKLTKAKNEGAETTNYTYSTSSSELGLLTTITEPSGNTIKITYNAAKQVKSVEKISAGQKAGPVTSYTYYAAGSAPSPCTATQQGTIVAEGGEKLLFCANVLDEVEGVTGFPSTGQPGWYPIEEASGDPAQMLGVNAAGGNFFVDNEDVSLTEEIAGMQLTRYYNSQAPKSENGLGPRWSWSAGPDVYLANLGGTVILHGPSGYVVPFALQSSGAYLGPPELQDTLTKASNGTFALSELSGITVDFNSEGVMTAYVTEGGETITVDDTTVNGISMLHTLADKGATIELSYSSAGEVSTVTSSTGTTRHYEYDSLGQLAVYIDAAGERTEYAYNSEEYLSKVTAPTKAVDTIDIVSEKVAEIIVAEPEESAHGALRIQEPGGTGMQPCDRRGRDRDHPDRGKGRDRHPNLLL